MSTTTENPLQCVVVTPERTVVDERADFVALPLYDGELGVLPGRAPLIGRLGNGELRLRRGESTKHYYVEGGFTQIRDDVVTVLTSRALKAEEIDPAKVQAEMDAAHQPASTPEGRSQQQETLAKGRTQLRVATKAPKQY
jgi:F-type H+-transporting ATPase subunit epsilon